jgi:hypothetical protein
MEVEVVPRAVKLSSRIRLNLPVAIQSCAQFGKFPLRNVLCGKAASRNLQTLPYLEEFSHFFPGQYRHRSTAVGLTDDKLSTFQTTDGFTKRTAAYS